MIQKILLPTITGETSEALSKVEVEAELSRLGIRHELYVADIDDDFIMGMDRVGKYGLVYDPKLRIIKYGNEHFVFATPEGEVIKYAYETTRIKGSSKQIVNGE